MISKKTKREYRGNSCFRCYRQKVKCSRENPCRNCKIAKQPCAYAIKDRKVTVTESYLKRLENAATAPKIPGDGVHSPRPSLQPVCQRRLSESTDTSPAHRPLAENLTTELFVSKLKEIQKPKPIPCISSGELAESPSQRDAAAQPPAYEYFALNSDTSHAKCTFRLPPYPYAIYLLNQFLTYVAHDWHWFRLRRFQQRLENIYKIADSAESRDRIWLCQLLVVFALASSINGQEPQPMLDFQDDTVSGHSGKTTELSTVIPGTEFFEQALGLLKIPYEEVSVEHVETLNLVALCSYSLNRQKTAYIYAGLSARMCNMLQLHKTSSSLGCSPVERENRKRVWWTTFCIDRMASTQMGLLPTLEVGQADLEYPTEEGLYEDSQEFTDPDYLTARVQLTVIQADATSSTNHFGDDDVTDIENVLRPIVQKLERWKTGLRSPMALDSQSGMFESTDNTPILRSLANLRLRYNQCLILLLRPLLLRQIAGIFLNEHLEAFQTHMQDLNDICLDSARSSLGILINLRTRGLLARFGFMENMHLFSSLMILHLAKAINARRPGSFCQNPGDDVTYNTGKDVLRDMIRAGSLAARGHERMLNDVEALGHSIMADTSADTDLITGNWDIDEWMAQLFGNENLSDMF